MVAVPAVVADPADVAYVAVAALPLQLDEVVALPDKAPINVVADIVLLSGCNVIPSVE